MEILVKNFIKKNPKYVADIIGSTGVESLTDIAKLDPENLNNIVSYLAPSYLTEVFESCTENTVQYILPHINDIFIARIYKHLQSSTQDIIINSLQNKKKRTVLELVRYSPEEIGHYLNHYEYVVNGNLSANEAMSKIEKFSNYNSPIYVVDSDYYFKGELNLLKLIKNRNNNATLIEVAVNKKSIVLKASSALRQIIADPNSDEDNIFPIVSKSNQFLGIFSTKNFAKKHQDKLEVKKRSDFFNEYMDFSEYFWSGLQKFWGSLR